MRLLPGMGSISLNLEVSSKLTEGTPILSSRYWFLVCTLLELTNRCKFASPRRNFSGGLYLEVVLLTEFKRLATAVD